MTDAQTSLAQDLGTKLRGYVMLMRDVSGVNTALPTGKRDMLHYLNFALATTFDRCRVGYLENAMSREVLLGLEPNPEFWTTLFRCAGFTIYPPAKENEEGVLFWINWGSEGKRRKYRKLTKYEMAKARAQDLLPKDKESTPEATPTPLAPSSSNAQ